MLQHIMQISFDYGGKTAIGGCLSQEDMIGIKLVFDFCEKPAGIKNAPYEAILITLPKHRGNETPASSLNGSAGWRLFQAHSTSN